MKPGPFYLHSLGGGGRGETALKTTIERASGGGVPFPKVGNEDYRG